MNDFAEAEQIALMATALAIGLLIGVERGWETREVKEGERIAGLRTYGLVGLLGGGVGILSHNFGTPVFGLVFLGYAASVIVAYAMQLRVSGDASITSLITMLLTFILGALTTQGNINLAASTAVVTVMLLRFKENLHSWLKKIEMQELHAALELLLISIVLLPILPNHGYGPWQVLNPYEIWWMVVLIAGISFIGYFFMKIAGPGKGVLLTALTAGMVSSTALTLHFSRLSQKQKDLKRLLASGILVSCGVMFPRIILISSLINRTMFNALIIPMTVMTLLTLFSAAIIWHSSVVRSTCEFEHMNNPLELKPALFFGGMLALVIFLSKATQQYFGDTGIYLLAALSGITDVDAINLSLSRMSIDDLSPDAAVLGIVVAASANTLVKAVLAVFVGGRGLAMSVLVPLLTVAAAGLATAWLI